MTVYVVQQADRWDPAKGVFVPKYDVSEARVYGEISYLLGPRANPLTGPRSIVQELKEKLAGFCDDDFLLLVGNPCLIGWAVAVAAGVNGTVNLLQWSGKEQRYIAVVSGTLPCEPLPEEP